SLVGLTRDKHLMLLIINIVLLIVGCFMEPVSVLLILVPMLLPIIDSLGIDRVHFGLVAVLNLMIGLITPPVGVCLYIVAKIANVSFESAVRATLPFMFTLIIVLFIITYVPWLVTVVPRLVLT
ncbi:MAG: TRAP transporter large permease subunit, partial [Acidobacteriota bacterium]